MSLGFLNDHSHPCIDFSPMMLYRPRKCFSDPSFPFWAVGVGALPIRERNQHSRLLPQLKPLLAHVFSVSRPRVP